MASRKAEEAGSSEALSYEEFKAQVLADYRLACMSREASLIGRKEVLTGKAKFGIFGDGKEVAQIALAKTFQAGDFRSGYYRDQTWVFASGMGTVEQFFSQLYADTDPEADPFSSGRQMNAHFATASLDPSGQWLNLTERKNSSADTSPTASQMARAVGLALASKYYRANPGADPEGNFSVNGNEVVFCTIGDASTSEGIFWEAINAAGVQKIPLAFIIWDDGYGISVPRKYQTTKDNISEVLKGFLVNDEGEGLDIYRVKGWDYPALCETFEQGIARIRETHIPAIFHVREMTQPQGHSTSGSHERYKSKERLAWETEFDCLTKMREWIIKSAITLPEELDGIEGEAKQEARDAREAAWKHYSEPIIAERRELVGLINQLAGETGSEELAVVAKELSDFLGPIRRDLIHFAAKALRKAPVSTPDALKQQLLSWIRTQESVGRDHYNTHLYSQSTKSALNVPVVPVAYNADSPALNGFEILNRYFDLELGRNQKVLAFGEDLGKIGDVNQGFAGLQDKHGEHRVFDTGIREATIMGQGIGLSMRGLRPIAEIQYLDYLLYGFQPLADDLATVHYRTKGRQKAPMVVRTRGHRLEGIWHTGSPMGMIINSLRGIYVLTPRNMVQAVGMYNTMMQSDDPALLIECLNGYRLKERLPSNLGDFTVPLGVPEILTEGTDVTVVSYGSTLRIVDDALKQLAEHGVSCELIDVQTLIPFDLPHTIAGSLRKTGRIVFVDEDVPGGASAYMLQKVLEEQDGYRYLDSGPQTVTGSDNRSAYASDGDYFCKPNAEQIFERVYRLMMEVDPGKYPDLW
jgi:pyruvate/2-oxoglutarate/acetoin dehydrogenase E1 component/TPP-dependent pyruvate/acetoin dehydrogenase alpha subunit